MQKENFTKSYVINTSMHVPETYAEFFLGYSYLSVKEPPLSDYYYSINFFTVSNLNCFIKFNLVFSVIHPVINYHLISILTSINHNLRKQHFITLVRFHLTLSVIQIRLILINLLRRDFVIHKEMTIRHKKKILHVSIHDIQMANDL